MYLFHLLGYRYKLLRNYDDLDSRLVLTPITIVAEIRKYKSYLGEVITPMLSNSCRIELMFTA